MSFQVLLYRFACQSIRRLHVAISAARADIGATSVHFHFKRVATSLSRIRRREAQKIVFILLGGYFLQARKQIVRVEDRKAAGSLRQRVEHLLIRCRGLRKSGNDCAWLSEVGICKRLADPPAWNATTAACSASSSLSACAAASRTATRTAASSSAC